MKNLPKEFMGRTVRAILFIGLVIVFCTAVSSAGMYLASRFSLTRSREQVPLTSLSIGREGRVELPRRGGMTEGDGWKLRNSRDSYTLTLDNAVIEGAAQEGDTGGKERAAVEETPASEGSPQPASYISQPAISISGDLTIQLGEGSGNWICSQGVGIQSDAGTLVIRGKGSLEIDAGQIGIDVPCLSIDESVGQVKVRGTLGAVTGTVDYNKETSSFKGDEKEMTFQGK